MQLEHWCSFQILKSADMWISLCSPIFSKSQVLFSIFCCGSVGLKMHCHKRCLGLLWPKLFIFGPNIHSQAHRSHRRAWNLVLDSYIELTELELWIGWTEWIHYYKWVNYGKYWVAKYELKYELVRRKIMNLNTVLSGRALFM